MKNIILYGAPAAGKGTQCELLVERYGYKHISMGDLFRSLDDSTEFNRSIHEKISKGMLIDDETTSQLLKNELDKLTGQHIVLDGFPRNLNQAKILDNFFKDYIVINIEISEEDAMKRALGRLTCPKCGKIYHIYTASMAPKVAGFCDSCNIELSSRSDDNEESFKTRFNIYLNNVKSVLEYYNEQQVLYVVKACESKEEVFEVIDKILKEQD